MSPHTRTARKPGESDAEAGLRDLIHALCDAGAFGHDTAAFKIVETHISLVLLTGPFAYKFKKPLDLGFLDFSTLERRLHYCREELRLNRRLAPRHYLDVVAVTGTRDHPRLGGDGPVLEYAVKMRQFDPGQGLDRLAEQGRLAPEIVTDLGARVADFHAEAERASAESAFGTPAEVLEPALANFAPLAEAVRNGPQRSARLARLLEWTRRMGRDLEAAFEARRAAGAIRECHGDMHLGNIVLDDGEPVIFDCLEFSDALRWIDVMNEVAFLFMDLEARGPRGHAWRFLNAYLERSGDFDGLAVLRFYEVYRALVRAKIAHIRMRQLESGGGMDEITAYIDLADRCAQPAPPVILLTHGLSGSGKTFCAGRLAPLVGAVHVRSDVERKRLYGLRPEDRSGSGVGSGLYTDAAGAATYGRLLDAAEKCLSGGFSVIVDAAFLRRGQRQPFLSLAERMGVAVRILAFRAPADLLEARLARRAAAGGDASEADAAVLEWQKSVLEPLDERESALALNVDPDTDPATLAVRLGGNGWSRP